MNYVEVRLLISIEQVNELKALLYKKQTELINQVSRGQVLAGEIPLEAVMNPYESMSHVQSGMLHPELKLKQINEALHAIEAGTYGICSICGAELSFEILKNEPELHRCERHVDYLFLYDHTLY